MTYRIFAVVTLLFWLCSCTEKGPGIDFSTTRSADTTFTINPETPELRRVLIEEATGVKCPNCPAGAKILKAADSVNPDRIVIIALHAGNLTSPLDESKYDFRNPSIMQLFAFFGGEPNKPAAVFDRTRQGTAYFVDSRSAWPGLINQRLQTASPIRLSLTSSYNAATMEDTIRVRISYTSTVSKPQSVGIVITEDGIVDPQEDGTIIIPDYKHEHVLRDFVTPINGISFLDTLATKKAGRVFEKTFIYKVPEVAFGPEIKRWNLDKCNVVGFVFNNEANDKEVVQAAEIKLK
jgi:hypothetical protein